MSTKVRVQFIKGPVASYSAENYAGAIYFATDEKKIYVDGIAYGGDIDATRIVSGVTWSEGKLYVQYLDGTMTAMDPEIPVATTTTAGLMSAEDKVKLDGIKDVEFVYDSAIEDVTLEMPNAVGGIAKGTTVESLEGRTISEILDDLLFPTVNPTYVNPSVTLSISGYSLTQEVGATAPTADNFTHSFSAGAINLNGVKQANRAGAETSESFIYVNNSASNNVLPETVALGDTTYKYRAYYAEGAQPKDNKGNDLPGNRIAAGTKDATKTYTPKKYWWIGSRADRYEDTTWDSAKVRDLKLSQDWTDQKTKTVTFPAGAKQQVIAVPAGTSWTGKDGAGNDITNTFKTEDAPKQTISVTCGKATVSYDVYVAPANAGLEGDSKATITLG